MSPQLIYGTATFGMEMTAFQDAEAVKNMLTTVQSLGIQRLDTASRYPPLNPGRSEQLIGDSNVSSKFVVDTKVYTNTQTDGSGDLSQDAMQTSVAASLDRLKRPEGVRHDVDSFPNPTQSSKLPIGGYWKTIMACLALHDMLALHGMLI